MLPRHVRRLRLDRHLPGHRPGPRSGPLHPATAHARAQLHSTPPRRDEGPRSPFQTFVDVLKEELRKNRALNENVRQLQGDVDKLQDSETLRRAKDMYERARLTASITENARLRAAAEELRRGGAKVSDAVGEALRTMEESEWMRGISKASAAASAASAAVSARVESATEPLRQTAAYRELKDTVLDALDDSGTSRHAGYEERDARRARRQARLARAGRAGGLGRGRVRADPGAGGAVVLHESAAAAARWETLKETSGVLRAAGALRRAYAESEHPAVAALRGAAGTVAGWFAESETAQVTRRLRALDPGFELETFTRELREYIVPELVDAYLSADREALRMWCGEATYSVLWATLEQYLAQGLVSDSKVLDIRNVDVSGGRILEDGDVPVWLVTFATQELLVFRHAATRAVVVGAEDRVEQCQYAAVLTRVESELGNDVTGGWRVVEMARRSSRAYL